MEKIIMVSGYFNPLHIGHIKLIKAAKKLGHKLIVIVNNDLQQKLKKGKIIMEENERVEIVRSLKYVDEVVLSIDTDPTIRETIQHVALQHPGKELIFGNGGDRKEPGLIPETPVCEKYGIEMIFDVGGNDKPNSSSNINKLRGLE